MSDPEKNKAIARRIFEVLLPDPTFSPEFDEIVHPEFTDNNPGNPAVNKGVAALRITHEFLHRTIPGGPKFVVDAVIAEGDHVAMRWSGGTTRAHAWFRFEDGKLRERWAIVVSDR